MISSDAKFADLFAPESATAGSGFLCRLDSRVIVITSAVYVFCVVSVDKYNLTQLLPYFLFPVLLIIQANLSFKSVLLRLVPLLPFAFFVGIFNPMLERTPFQVGPFTVAAGWISFLSILLRFLLTAGTACILIATTGFYNLCRGLGDLGAPKIFVTQLLFLYRYLFVLGSEVFRIKQAVNVRSGIHKIPLKLAGPLLGSLLLRSLSRARRIHLALLSRGFNGQLPRLEPKESVNKTDMLFTAGWCLFFVIARMYNLPEAIGIFFEYI